MAQITEKNPIGLNGVDFIEYSGPDAHYFEQVFKRYAFKEVGQVHGKNIRLYRQGDINYILNCEPQTFATDFAKLHGNCICATGFRVVDAQHAFKEAVARGARPYEGNDHQKGATPFPAIYGIGDSLIYFMDDKNQDKLYNEIFQVKPEDKAPEGVGFKVIDHFTNNVPKGEMDKWYEFYVKIFNFYEAHYFDIRGSKTGLLSRAMRSPCGKFSVPINEPTESKSQIQEYLDEYKGSGIQHVALLTNDILSTLEKLKNSDIQFLTPPPHSYYEMLPGRVPNVTEDLGRLEKNAILVDGDKHGYLLQIFTKNTFGPIFYEVIQRKGHDGFGDGNFQALFDAIERDQKERGYLT
ncbi:4-hydroxyphenylpyruvate dioxygenase [Bdellovibrio sp. HCB-162]|uniref:4-hydroxyphenylpyruvate dioxygenase n=1 Tax=Bdellovibrio sp. HCB-162 TaxID=3394234 RepID=UPI0039BD0444